MAYQNIKRIGILMFLLILCSPSVLSTGLQDDLVLWLKMDEANANAVDSSATNLDFNETSGVIASVAGKIGTARQLVKADTEYFIGSNAKQILFDKDIDYSISFWAKLISANADNEYILRGQTATQPRCYLGSGGDEQKIFCDTGGVAGSYSGAFVDDTWIMITLTWDATNARLIGWMNNASWMNSTGVATEVNSSDNYQIGGSSAGTYLDGTIDDFKVYHRVLHYEDISTLYNYSNGYDVDADTPLPASTLLTSSLLSPTNNTIYTATDFTINSTSNSSEIFNISLYVNNALNQTVEYAVNGSNVETTFNVSFALDFEGNISYYFYMENDLGNTSTSGTYILFVDNVLPNINWSLPSDSNNSIIQSNFTTNITIYDPNLYSYYFNITHPNGTVVYTYSNASLTGLDVYQINLDVLLNESGEYYAVLDVYDGHTNNKIKNWLGTGIYNQEMIFDKYVDNVKIYSGNKNDLDKYEYYKLKDRYKFNVRNKKYSDTLVMYVESDYYIDVLNKKTEYKGHLVTNNKWIDFEGDNIKSVEIERITDKKVKVIVQSYTSQKLWKFESIGELNQRSETVKFYNAVNSTSVNDATIIGSSETYRFNLSYNANYYSSVPSAWLSYNGSNYLASSTNTSTQYNFYKTINVPNISKNDNVTYYWIYSINGVNYTTDEQSQEVFDFYLDSCDTYNTVALNYSFKNHETYATLTANITGTISYTNGIYTKTHSFNRLNLQNATFCIFPAFANFTSDITLSATSGGFAGTDYIQEDFLTDNITNHISIYLIESTSYTAVTFHVIDSADNDLSDIKIEAFKYDLSSNTDILVAVENTDSEGNAVFQLIADTQYYSFKFYKNGVLELSTSRFQIYSTSYEYTIYSTDNNLLLEKYSILSSFDYEPITFNNDSSIFNFSWTYSGDSISSVCFNVTYANRTHLYSSCTNSVASGYLNHTVTITNNSYFAFSYVVSTSGYAYMIDSLSVDKRKFKDILGYDNSIFFSILIALIIIFAALASRNVSVILGSTAVVITILAYMEITAITTTMAIIYDIFIISLIVLVRSIK